MQLQIEIENKKILRKIRDSVSVGTGNNCCNKGIGIRIAILDLVNDKKMTIIQDIDYSHFFL